MGDYLKRTLRFFALVALFPFLVGFIGSWANGVGFFLFLFGTPLALLILVIGAICFSIRGAKLAPREAAGRHRLLVCAAAPLLLVATLATAWPLLATGRFTGSFARLMANRSSYDAVVARASTVRRPAWYANDGGVTYSVDLGPPVRVAFNPAGFLDNWSAIIYDPTGEVMLADGFDPRSGRFRAPDRITKLFEGDLVSCRHLWGDYYDCSFT